MKTVLIFLTIHLFGINEAVMTQLRSTLKTTQIEIKKNRDFKGKDLEVLYTTICTNTSRKQMWHFEIIKTDKTLKNYFLSDFILIEKTMSNEKKYYPIGWETSLISEQELRSSCISIMKGNINPVDINK